MKANFNAGDLDRKGTWYQRQTVISNSGQPRFSTVEPTAELPCYMEEVSGKESKDFDGGNVGDKIDATAKTRFVVRYKPEIKPTDEWEFEGTRYNIDSVAEAAGRRQWTVITAIRKDNA